VIDVDGGGIVTNTFALGASPFLNKLGLAPSLISFVTVVVNNIYGSRLRAYPHGLKVMNVKLNGLSNHSAHNIKAYLVKGEA
jgi:hypothetical protein